MDVKDIMHKPVTAGKDISLKEAAKIMSDKHVGSLIILDKDKIAGIITEADITGNIDRLDKRCEKIMSDKIIAVEKDESLEEAAKIMSENKIKRIPVIDEMRLVGIISATDIIANIEDLGEEFFF
ncbi:CBS domain-containing protein [Candidatus Pacearchaeota archaeon]|nr:CBS domain-containing protein [Candidatus Pacearchaeota archaeon]